MDKTQQPEHLKEVLDSLSPERRAEVEKLATELSKNKDLSQAASILEHSETLENSKLVGQLGWLAALATALAVIAA